MFNRLCLLSGVVIISLLFGFGKCSSNDTNASLSCTYDWDVDFVGKSGQFKIFPCEDSNYFIKVKLQTIQAYDSDGSKQNQNKVTSFSYASAVSGEGSVGNSSVYTWKDADDNDVTLGGVTLTYEFDVDDTIVEFEMNVYLIDDITIVEYVNSNGNGTYSQTLSQGTVKFDFKINNWPFENDDDMLEIALKFTTGGVSDDGEDDGSSDGSSSFSWGDEFVLKMPETYQHTTANGTQEGKDANITFDLNSNGGDVSILFLDAGDAYSIVYDPWVTGASEREGDAGAKIFSTPVMLFIMVFVVALMQ